MQYTLRWLLALVLFAASLCALFLAVPDKIGAGLLCVLAVTITPFTVALIVYGRGGTRAFGVGSSVASLSAMGVFGGGSAVFAMMLVQYLFESLEDTVPITGSSEPEVMKWWIALYLGWIVICGLVAVAARWLCLPLSHTNSARQTPLQKVTN